MTNKVYIEDEYNRFVKDMKLAKRELIEYKNNQFEEVPAVVVDDDKEFMTLMKKTNIFLMRELARPDSEASGWIVFPTK